MNKYKKIILFISCIILTGCTTNYNLEINMKDNIFNETIKETVLDSELTDDETDTNIYSFLLNGNNQAFYNASNYFYNQELNKENNLTNYTYTYTFNKENYKDSNILNSCFDKVNITEEEDKYKIILSGNFSCNYAEETIINIKTNSKVLANNANKINKDTYTWKIDKNKSDNLFLYMTISTTELNKTNFTSWSTFKTIGLIIIVILSAFCIYVLKKKSNNNY